MMEGYLPVLVPLVFFAASLVIPLVGNRHEGAAFAIALATTAAGFAASLWGLNAVLDSGTIEYRLGDWPPPIGIELVMDRLSSFVLVVVNGVAFGVLWHSGKVTRWELGGRETAFYGCCMLLLGGLAGMVVTGDLFNFYVFLEISSLAGYALISRGDRRAPVSAFRYLLLGTVGASFYLLGIGFLLLQTGSLNMQDVAEILQEIEHGPAVRAALLLMVFGLGVKMAMFPLHGWLPDAYTHASSAATALIAPIGTKVAAYGIIRVMYYVFDPAAIRWESNLSTIIGYLGVGGILWGSIMAMAQRDLKRMLAYSSVGQVGYLGVGIGLASPLGLIGAVLHILNHAVMKACLFLVATNFLTRLAHADVSRLNHRLRLQMPWTCAALVVAALSMIGLPPTAGFFSKWYLVMGSLEESQWLFVAAILVSSLLNAVYFFRVLERVYLRPTESREASGESHEEIRRREKEGALRDEASFSMLAPTCILGAALLVLGLGNAFLVEKVLMGMIPPGL